MTGRWLVDGVDISTYAYNVTTRAGSWRVPGRRGENAETQSRHGAVWIPGKPYQEADVSFNMFAVGCLPDGTVPPNSRMLCKEHLERLIALFTKDTGLVELTRIDSGDYGSLNQARNPSFETWFADRVLYENRVWNPELDFLAGSPPSTPTTWSVTTGVPVTGPAGQFSADRSGGGTDDVVYATPVSITVTGGLEPGEDTFPGGGVFPGTDANGTVLVGVKIGTSVPCDIYIQLFDAGTMRAETYVGSTVPGLAATPMQGVLDLEDQVTQMRIVARLPDGDTSVGDRSTVYAAYAIPAAGSGLPRLLPNQLQNSAFLSGVLGWSINDVDSPPIVTGLTSIAGDWGPALRRVGGGMIVNRRRIPVTPGEQLALFGRVAGTAGTRARFTIDQYGVGGHIGEQIVGDPVTMTGQAQILDRTWTVPAGVNAVVVNLEHYNTVTGSELIVSAIHAGIVQSGREYGPGITPTRWLGVVGGGVDSQGLPAVWAGTPGGSVTQVRVAAPARMFGDGITWDLPSPRPPAATGRVLTFQPGTSTAEAVSEVMATPNGVVSGSVAYARDGGVLTVDVLGVSSQDDPSPVVLRTWTITDETSGTLTWQNTPTIRPYVMVRVRHTGTRVGGTPQATIDRLLVVTTVLSEPPIYFDGATAGSQWTGTPNDSPSIWLAGARRAFAECVEQVQAQSMAGATRAEIEFTMKIPAVFWEDTIDTVFEQIGTGSDFILDLAPFAYMTAPLEDAVLTVTVVTGSVGSGSQPGIRVIDVASGCMISAVGAMANGASWTADCKQQTLKDGAGNNIVSKLWKSGNARFFTLNSPGYGMPPQLQVVCPTLTPAGQIRVRLVGRRKFKIA